MPALSSAGMHFQVGILAQLLDGDQSATCAQGFAVFGSAVAANGVSDLPHPPQNFSLPSFRKAQDWHVGPNDNPHSPQKRRPSRFSA